MPDYNLASTEIYVSPQTMHRYAAEHMKVIMTDLIGCWETIGQTWESIKIGWIGESADAADEFNTRLKDIQERLFGVPTADGEGVETPGLLDKVRSGVVVAAANYNNAEHSVTDMWDAFCAQMEQEPEASDGSPPPANEDTTLDPIKADYSDNPYPWHKPEES
ncbi:hypothetical protein O3597_04060 [Verrucosispora sp. WMMA2044]|uniref:WXG100 family type VII secretion target n=1 Tax=Verrucosispora sioxanthis TaxID=2499994 RepID=A0A6M1LBL0_9ACTN|nr:MULTISPECIES: hypothetical protein [Micromonospora]NEE66540.1 hypothetical protein [Verrucosispora sioxanthis]NGM15650.1 hypothetical protein [Verrucosispora sioxanthis]WBB49668.1 hypothetical protein O3597_04060 [Verrucosispora sp. WMMA2044]